MQAVFEESSMPVSAAQLGVWNAQRLDPDFRHYLVDDVLEISGELVVRGAPRR
jgi:hypothetical protein